MEKQKVYTLVRGDRIIGTEYFNNVQLILNDQDKNGQEKIESIAGIVDIPNSWDFSNAAYSVTLWQIFVSFWMLKMDQCFCADKDIALTALGFWGPQTGESAKYRVKFNIYELSSLRFNADQRLLVAVDKHIEGRKQSVMYVAFDEPVKCMGDRWIRIKFMVNGPKTCMTQLNRPEVQMPGVNFEFAALCSKQLPEIRYRLLKE